MNLEIVKEKIIKILEKSDLELYSLKQKRKFGLPVLEVLVDGDEMDSNKLGRVNQEINDEIDEFLPVNYYLEVSTAGAIRPIKSSEEAKKYIGKYILVKKENKEVKGVLEKVEDDTLYIKINQKGRMSIIETSFKEANEVMLTVKY